MTQSFEMSDLSPCCVGNLFDIIEYLFKCYTLDKYIFSILVTLDLRWLPRVILTGDRLMKKLRVRIIAILSFRNSMIQK